VGRQGRSFVFLLFTLAVFGGCTAMPQSGSGGGRSASSELIFLSDSRPRRLNSEDVARYVCQAPARLECECFSRLGGICDCSCLVPAD